VVFHRDVAVDDRGLPRVQVADDVGDLAPGRRVADAVDGQVERLGDRRGVTGRHRVDEAEHGHVDALEHRGDDDLVQRRVDRC
jgi:hypothetical protein